MVGRSTTTTKGIHRPTIPIRIFYRRTHDPSFTPPLPHLYIGPSDTNPEPDTTNEGCDMTMKATITAVIFLAAYSMHAQTTVWQQSITFPETTFVEDAGVDLAMLPGGDLLLLGGYDSAMNNEMTMVGIELARVGQDGTIRWAKRLHFPGRVTPVALLPMSDTLFAIVGWVEDSISVADDERVWIGLADTSGAVTFQGIFPQIDMRLDQIKRSMDAEFSDSGYVASGVRMGEAVVLITAPDLGFVTARSYSRGVDLLSTAIAPSIDGGYLLVMNMRDGDRIRPEVLGLDRHGDSIWSLRYMPKSTEVWNDILPTADGGFIVAGTTGHEDVDRFGNLTVTKYEIARYVQWRVDRKYWVFDGDSTGINVANRIVPMEDGRIMIVGRTGQGYTVPFLLELDRNGKETFQYITGPLEFSESDARAIVPLSDDEFIVLGTKYLDMWVARVKREVSDVREVFEEKKLDLSER